jgi:CBS domain
VAGGCLWGFYRSPETPSAKGDLGIWAGGPQTNVASRFEAERRPEWALKGLIAVPIPARLGDSFGSKRASDPGDGHELERTITIKNHMRVQNVMSSHVEVVRPDSSIAEAAKKMKSLDVGALPVCDGERLVGMITDRDITIEATAESRDPDYTRCSGNYESRNHLLLR